MKVLVINTAATQRNGITNVICNLQRGLQDRDVSVDLLAINKPEADFCQLFGKVHVLNRSISHPLRYIKALSRLIAREGYDMIHAHGSSATLALEMVAAKRGGCPVRIAHCHSTSCIFKKAHTLLKPLFRSCYTHAVACSQAAGQWLFENRPFTVLNNGIDTRRFRFSPEDRQQVREGLGVAPQRLLIGQVGKFDDNKNQGFTVEVLHRLVRNGGDYALVFIGDGALRESVSESIRNLGLEDRVYFAGVTDQVQKYLSGMDLLVMPSRVEGLPLSLIEAQASGLACFVSDNVTREVDKTGYVQFLPLQEDAWVSQIQNVQVPFSRENASQKGAACICDAGYDNQVVVQQLYDLYKNAAQKG